MRTWKRFERILASELGGVRHPVTGRGGEFPDVETEHFAIEAKTRRLVPEYMVIDDGTVSVFRDGLAMITLGTFLSLCRGELSLSELTVSSINRGVPGYVDKWRRQAVGFGKVPVLVVHKDRTRIQSSTVIIDYNELLRTFGNGGGA